MSTKSRGSKQHMAARGTPKTGDAVSTGDKQPQKAMDATGTLAATGTPKTGGAVSTGDEQPQKAMDATGTLAVTGTLATSVTPATDERRYPTRDRSAPSSPQQTFAPPKKRAKTNSPLQVTHPQIIIQMII